MDGYEASVADVLLDKMRKLAKRLEDEKRFSKLASENSEMLELWNEYMVLKQAECRNLSKCFICGGLVKKDDTKTYTSLPAKYDYVCQSCGHKECRD